MSSVKGTLYLKIEENVVLEKADVTIKDVAKIQLEDKVAKGRINLIRLHQFDPFVKGKNKQVMTFSILKVIELIQKEYPQISIVNLGESDFIVHYVRKQENPLWQFVKVCLISIIIFFGAAFMIITFNREIAITLVLDFVYGQLTGIVPKSATILDISFCIGLPIGVLVFYNHFGRKKLTDDPTPIQVAMRKYEQDVDKTYIENSSREGKNIDID